MCPKMNECGVKNSFGYYDYRAKEIILKHPCLRKADVNDVYSWIDSADDLKKVSIGIGAVENCIVDDTNDNLYSSARRVLFKNLQQTAVLDNQVLNNILSRLKDKSTLRNLALKCYLFADDAPLFNLLLQVIETAEKMVYLDLSGCYFTDEQLVALAKTVSHSHIAHLVWPEPRMAESVQKQVKDYFMQNHSLVVLQGVPSELQTISHDNRRYLFSLAKHPSLIDDKKKAIISEYADSIRLGIAFEKQNLFDLEKVIEAVLV